MANYRDRRVAQEILKEVNQILRKKVRDPSCSTMLPSQMFA